MGETDHSVYALISALCRNLSSNLENADAEATDRFLLSLRRIAFSHLLKRSETTLEENRCFTENIPFALFILLASKKSSKHEWSRAEYTQACMILDKLEEKFQNASESSWLCHMGRMLIALELSRPVPSTTSSHSTTWRYPLRNIGGLECIPKPFQPHTSKFLTQDLNDEFSPITSLWTHFKAHFQSFQLPKRLDAIWAPESRRLAIEQSNASSGMEGSTSSSKVDEGFCSPTPAAGTGRSQPFDWSIVPIKPKIPNLEWESFSYRREKQYAAKGRRRIYRNIKLSPCKLVKVPYPELIECIKALLLGVPSHLFEQVNDEFLVTPGLYTDETPPDLMYIYCKPFRITGMLFSKLTELSEYFLTVTSASMSVVIQNFVLEYQTFIKSVPESTGVLELTLAITPFICQFDYLVDLAEEKIFGWKLLEKLYDDSFQMVDPNLHRLSSALFLDCYHTYLTFIEKWIFEGRWHPELFFLKHTSVDDICDRYTWMRSYTFDTLKAPQCLPSAGIYECGKLVLLVQNRTGRIDERSVAFDCRPKVRMVTDIDDFMSMKHQCHFYSQTGDELRLEALQKFKSDHDYSLSSAAKKKAEADSVQYCVSITAEREKLLAKKLGKAIKMKQQLVHFKDHRNIKELKRNLYELLEDDRLTYYEIEKIIKSFPYRYELIEQYIQNEECCTKRSLINCWKEKRYNLNCLRTHYFDRCLSNTDSMPISSDSDTDISSSHDTIDDANIAGAYQSISSISNKLPVASNPLIGSVDGSSSDITMSTPVGHHLDEKKVLTFMSSPNDSSFFTCVSPDASVRSDPNSEIIVKSPDATSDALKVATEDVMCSQRKTSTSVEDTSSIIAPSTSIAAKADLSRLSDDPSPGSSKDVSPSSCLFGSRTYSGVNRGSEPLQNISSSETKTERRGSLVNQITTKFSQHVDDDVLEPFRYIEKYYNRKDNANVSGNSPPKFNNQHANSMNELSKSHLHFLIAKSIEYPLQAQTSVMNNLAVHKLFVENDLIGHLKRLRDVFLKNNGCGAQTFTNMMCTHIAHDDPRSFLVHHKLQNVANIAYPADSKFVSLKADYIPQAFDSTNPDVFGFLRFRYSRSWPLNLVITDMALLKYNDVFQFLTRIDLTHFYLQRVVQFLRLKFMKLEGEHFIQIQLHRHIMLTYINSLKFYTGSIVADFWTQMHNELHTVHDPDELYRVHVQYLKDLHIKLLLHKNSDRIQECLTKAIHYVLVYCQTILHSEWKISENGQCTHPKFKKLLHTFGNFKEMALGAQSLINYYVVEHGYAHLQILSQLMN